MKTCPICHAVAFDDAPVCYGCLHRFDGEDAPSAAGGLPPDPTARPGAGAQGNPVQPPSAAAERPPQPARAAAGRDLEAPPPSAAFPAIGRGGEGGDPDLRFEPIPAGEGIGRFAASGAGWLVRIEVRGAPALIVSEVDAGCSPEGREPSCDPLPEAEVVVGVGPSGRLPGSPPTARRRARVSRSLMRRDRALRRAHAGEPAPEGVS